MEEQENYAPDVTENLSETAAETAEDVTAEPEALSEGETPAVTPPATDDAKEKALLKAAQEERRKRQEIKEDRDFWHKVAIGEIDNPTKATAAEKPKAEQFDSYDDYVEALADYKAEQAVKRIQEQTRTLTREQMAQREEQRLVEKAKQDAAKAAEKYTDFYDVASAVQLPKPTMDAMYASEIGPELAYYLGKNPTEYERISDLTPARQIMELGKLEVKLASKTANPDRKLVKKATSVETAGNGFEKPKFDTQKLRDKAIATGSSSDWADYLMKAGLV